MNGGAPGSGPVTLVTVLDDGYAMPTAVMLRSALEHLDPDRAAALYVLGLDLSQNSRERIAASLPTRASDTQVNFISVTDRDLGEVKRGRLVPHVTLATYAKALIPELLPEECTRALYLDGDILVRRDLSPLHDWPFAGALAAIPDVLTPVTGAESRELYCRLGLPLGLPYFNAGVMVMNLDMWRLNDAGRRMLDLAAGSDAGLNECSDQTFQNVVACGDFTRLPLTWNFQVDAASVDVSRPFPFTRSELEEAIADPAVVHFNGAAKPWNWAASALDETLKVSWEGCLSATQYRDWQCGPLDTETVLRAWLRRGWRRFEVPLLRSRRGAAIDDRLRLHKLSYVRHLARWVVREPRTLLGPLHQVVRRSRSYRQALRNRAARLCSRVKGSVESAPP